MVWCCLAELQSFRSKVKMMHPGLILALAIAIVLIGILVFRLHAFIALLLAALTVALLTPTHEIERAELKRGRLEVTGTTDDGAIRLSVTSKTTGAGAPVLVMRDDGGKLQVAATLTIDRFEKHTGADGKTKETALAVFQDKSASKADEGAFKLQQADVLVFPAVRAAASATARSTAPKRVTAGFGKTCAGIGILIAMAAIIGKCLLDSGAADRVVRSALRVTGERGAPGAFVASGFLLGIPVFFDTVFYLMIPLGKAMRLRTGGNYLLYILTIVAGGTMAHSLVPPTPGPLLVANELGVNLLTMIVAGGIVGLFASFFGYLFAWWISSRKEIPLRESADMSLAELQKLADKDDAELPPLLLSVAPIVLPVLLIAAQTALKTLIDAYPSASDAPGWAVAIRPFIDTVGDKNVALIIAAAIALATLAWIKRSNVRELTTAVQTALASAGVIILITAAGGAFGATVRQCGVAEEIGRLTQGIHPLMILPVAFLVTTLVRTAQGSATVAMITAVSVLDQFAAPGVLNFHPVYLALAIGCGSKPVAWMADSGFWVICKMSGMTEAEGLQTVTPLSIVMGVAGLVATIAGALLLPMN